ncbi:MAG: NAD(P)-dependent alcohol dehydrogenase [Verrucomicrobiota bacterium]
MNTLPSDPTKKFKTKAYGATGTPLIGKSLQLMEVERSGPGEKEVLIEVLYCGICHSDIHQVANDWKNTIYPCVPGHEIVGRIVESGSGVTKFNTGDVVGVGCMVDSCRSCGCCHEGEEQFCEGPVGPTMTYNGYFKPDGTGFNTFGGFSTHVVVNEDFVLNIPSGLEITAVAPILCAGVTTYSPLKRWNVKRGDEVAIVGIGGLGHMAVMIAKAMGATVTAITTREEKRTDAMVLGANRVLISEDEEAMKTAERAFDFMLVTIPEGFDVNQYVPLLKARGSLVTVGLLGPYKEPTNNMLVAKLGRSVGGSLIGGVAETQEVLDFCDEHGILPHVQMVEIGEVNDAFEKIKDEEVRFRYVIDLQSLKD